MLNLIGCQVPHERLIYLFSRLELRPGSDCWHWTAGYRGRASHAQASMRVAGKQVGVHRLVYELFHGPIPAGMQIDHLCRTTWCCNPFHLEAVTPRENTMRGVSIPAQNAAKACCVHGHELTGENVYVSNLGHRHCKVCRRERMRRYTAAKRADLAIAAKSSPFAPPAGAMGEAA